MRYAWLLCCAVGIAPVAYVDTAHAENLTFADAVKRAGSDGPKISAGMAAVSAAKRMITPSRIAASTWT